MKAQFKAKIIRAEKTGGEYHLTLQAEGKVATPNINAQECFLCSTLKVKAVVGNEMKLGSIYTITVSDEGADEETYSSKSFEDF
jgi:hypothetical protein